MLLYIVVGFIIPWVLGIYLIIRIPKIMIIFVPVGMAISFLINTWGFNYYWQLKYSFEELSFSALPFDLGLYPILYCMFIGSIYFNKLKVYSAIIIFTTGTTFIELWAVIQEQVIYRNGWNIYLTSISYLIAYSVGYLYYKVVIKFKILDKI